MAKKKNQVDKNKIVKTVGVASLVIIVCLICFFASSSKSIKYSKTNSTTSTTEDENSVLEQATKDAGNVSDDERKSPDEISIDDYMNIYNGDDYKLVLISRPTCQYCKIATPILENIIYEDNVKINYINSDNLSSEDNATLINSDDDFSEGYGTPLLFVVGKGEIKDKIEGLVDKETYKSFIKEYGFME